MAPLTFYRMLSPRRRRQLALLLTLMVAGAVAEMITIGAALPFLALIAAPGEAGRFPTLTGWIERIGGDPLLAASLLLAVAAVAAAALRVALSWYTHRFVTAVGHDLASGIFSRMLRQPYVAYVRRSSSEILSGIEKVQQVVNDLLMPAMQALTAAFIAGAIMVLLCLVDPFALLIAAGIVTAVYAGLSLANRERLRRNSAILSDAATARVKVVQEGLGGIRDVILDRAQPLFEERFARADARYRRAQSLNTFIAAAPRFVVEAAGIIAIVLIAWLMSRQPGGITAAIPVLGALALGAQRLLPLMHQAYSGFTLGIGNVRLLGDIAALVDAPIAGDDAGGTSLPFERSIRLRSVAFGHPDGSFALADIGFEIARGERIGVAGPTGSGKSTLLDLVMGLLEPDSGEILIDGTPLDAGTRGRWRAQIAHVPQSVYLADESIAANIAFGIAPAAVDHERVRSAAAIAQLDGFVTGLPQGYETRVGERGIRLSGGQRQRVGIARALYKQAPVLILDEATSALDDATEAAVLDALMALGGITVVMIAHRMSTLAGCDRIIRLEEGRLARP
jgi:ATP-binding cassette, subfamily B, bacterial PglK